ncbi:response regulator transcription factor [Lentzea sp. NPDC051838]|uniref:response regulator transcription factor n=1 Tax=Lentzea sp. NPDC051838 TaxID=3154849 RepID=UPI00342D22D8
MALIRILVADDDPQVRAGLRTVLGGADDLLVAGEASDGQEVVDLAVRDVPDVVLMDIRMPRMDGLRATVRLRERGVSSRILVLTTFDTDDLVLAALRAGASGFLLKDTAPQDIVVAVRRVAAGEPALSPAVTSRVIAAAIRPNTRQQTARALVATLTGRERDVALLISDGLTNQEIARTLHMGLATVKTHVGNVFVKFGATNRVQVARYVHDAELG